MSLHDRIMAINVQGDRKRADVRADAAQLAKEADELMAEMAEALEQCLYVMERGHCQNTREQAREALDKYKERTK